MGVVGTSYVQFDADLRPLLAAIEKAKQAAAGIGPIGVPSSGNAGSASPAAQANGFIQLQRAQAALEQQEARLARTRGDATQAAALEASAIQRLTALHQAQNTTTAATIGIERQLVGVEQQMARAQQQNGGLTQQFGQAVKSNLLGIVGPAALATAALTALKEAADLTVEGETINKVDRSFQQLTRSAGESGSAVQAALRKASGNEISDLNIELAANKGLLLGVATNATQFADLMTIARDRAAKFGGTTAQAFDDIVTGIGRESPRILDNLGIIVDADKANKDYAKSIGVTVDQLSKAQRIQALENAVVAQGKATLDPNTIAANNNANGYARLAVALENAKNKLGSFLATQTEPAASQAADLFSGNLASYSKASVAQNLQAYGVSKAAAESFAASYAKFLGLKDSDTAATHANTTAIQSNALASQQGAAANDARRESILGVRAATENQGTAAQKSAGQIALARAESERAALAQKGLYEAAQAAALGEGSIYDAAVALARQFPITAQEAAILIGQLKQIAILAPGAALLADQAANTQKLLTPAGLGIGAPGITSGLNNSVDAVVALQQANKKAHDDQIAGDLALARAQKNYAREIALLREQQQGLSKDSREYKELQAQIIGVQEEQKNAGRGGATKGLNPLDQDAIKLAGDYQAQLDEVNRQLEKGNLTQHQRNELLIKQAELTKKIREETEKTRDAELDAASQVIEDRKQRRDEQRQLQFLTSLAAHATGERQQAAQDEIDLIRIREEQRQRAIARAQQTAGLPAGAVVALADTSAASLSVASGAGNGGTSGAASGRGGIENLTIDLIVGEEVLASAVLHGVDRNARVSLRANAAAGA